MKKVMSIIIIALCCWIIRLIDDWNSGCAAFAAIIIGVKSIYFIVLCFVSEDDGAWD